MRFTSADDVKSFVLNYLLKKAPPGDFDVMKIDDTFDFLEAGIIDSMGLLEMIEAMEDHFKITVDFEQMDTEKFTILGCFSRYVAEHAVAVGRGDNII